MKKNISTELIYKTANTLDMQTIMAILEDAALWLKSKDLTQWSMLIKAQGRVVEWIQQGLDNGEFILIENENKIIGTFRLQWKDELFWGAEYNDGKAGYLHSFALISSYRNQGLGTHILSDICNRCLSNKKSLLRIDCDGSNNDLVKYYLNHGFKKHSLKIEPGKYEQLFLEKII